MSQQDKVNLKIKERKRFVLHTIIMRLSEQNALRYLEAKGYKIALSTLQADKKAIRNGALKDKFNLIEKGLYEQHKERIDELETIMDKMWDNYNAETKPFNRAKILEMIAGIQPLLSNYYNLSQEVIENDTELKKLFGSRLISQSAR